MIEGTLKVLEIIFNRGTPLSNDDAMNLYSVLGIIVNFGEKLLSNDLRTSTFVTTYNALFHRLTESSQSPLEADKTLWTLRFLNNFSKGLGSNESLDSMKECFK